MKKETKEILRFYLKIILFLLPFIIVLFFPVLILVLGGEFISIKKVASMQAKGNIPVYYGSAYSNPDNFLKLQSVLYQKPKVLILGTSRSMQFRSKFCIPEAKLYNAGGGVSRMKHFIPFLNCIPQKTQPEIIICVLDQNFFNPDWDKIYADDIYSRLTQDINPVGVLRTNIVQIYKDYKNNKIALTKLIEKNSKILKIGIKAKQKNSYFRNDGSVHNDGYYFNPIDNPESEDYQFAGILKRVHHGVNRFEYSKDISKDNIEEVHKFLSLCNQRKIYVIGILPPYAHEVYLKMKSMGDKYGYLHKINPALEPLFKKYGFDYYDFSDIISLGSDDRETIDGYHGSEKAYLRLFIKIAENNQVLKKYTDIPYLKKRLDETKGYYTVFADEM